MATVQCITRYEVDSYLSHFALILVNSYSFFRSIRTHKIFLRSIHPHLVNLYTFCSIRSQFGQFVLTLKSTNLKRNKKKLFKYNKKEILHENLIQFTFIDFNL